MFGFTNLVSNSNWMGDQAREVVRRMPMSRIILETDSPYFRPRSLDGLMEVRGQPQFSHPVHLIAAAKTVAETKGMSVEDVLAQSDINISWVYKLPSFYKGKDNGKGTATEVLDAILRGVVGQMSFDKANQLVGLYEKKHTAWEQSKREELQVRMMGLGVSCEVMVSAVESPDKLYLQLAGSKLVELNHMNSKLTALFADVANQKRLAVEEIGVGMMVAAQFGSNIGFFRALVVAVDDRLAELLYVDFGDWDCQALSSVFKLPCQFRDFPYQAVPCCLAGVSPSGSAWSEESIDCLMELTRTASGQVLWVKLVDWKLEEGFGLLPCVELYLGNCSINHSLVRTGHANFR